MKKKDKIKKVLAQHKQELNDKFKVKRLGLFGSYIRNEQGKNSDVDVLVDFKETPSLFEFIRLENYLSGLLGAKADLVMRSALKPAIGKRILSEVIYL